MLTQFFAGLFRVVMVESFVSVRKYDAALRSDFKFKTKERNCLWSPDHSLHHLLQRMRHVEELFSFFIMTPA